jgi:type III restriction enzyme
MAGEIKPCYPDFVVFRRIGNDIRASIIDPHSVHLPDAPAKAVGLAEYAAKHSMQFGGIDLVIVDDGVTHPARSDRRIDPQRSAKSRD